MGEETNERLHRGTASAQPHITGMETISVIYIFNLHFFSFIHTKTLADNVSECDLFLEWLVWWWFGWIWTATSKAKSALDRQGPVAGRSAPDLKRPVAETMPSLTWRENKWTSHQRLQWPLTKRVTNNPLHASHVSTVTCISESDLLRTKHRRTIGLDTLSIT